MSNLFFAMSYVDLESIVLGPHALLVQLCEHKHSVKDPKSQYDKCLCSCDTHTHPFSLVLKYVTF